MTFMPMSIRRQGLQNYLDSTMTHHNGLDYRVFSILYRSGVNPSNLARAFNVKTRNTVIHWIKIYKEELNTK